MASVIPGYNYGIHLRLSYGGHDFISYRQKDNKHEGWVTEFVNQCQEANSLRSIQVTDIFHGIKALDVTNRGNTRKPLVYYNRLKIAGLKLTRN